MADNTWQLCPKCNGSGAAYSPFSNGTSAVCDVCDGKKIISVITGLPPQAQRAKVTITKFEPKVYVD